MAFEIPRGKEIEVIYSVVLAGIIYDEHKSGLRKKVFEVINKYNGKEGDVLSILSSASGQGKLEYFIEKLSNNNSADIFKECYQNLGFKPFQ